MIIEIRTYRLHPGTREEFVRVMREESVPLLRAHGIDVVDCGPSLVDEDGHEEAYLIRAFASLAHHREREDAFYGSDAWRLGPREAIVSRIASCHSIVVPASEAAITALRR
ncbi:NIPSNAP family protein [Kitasatospora aureofaciens]|uniref:NIPSNAP family protein n=1 Tax=Kitasatospora aureofaciens TaxID=1894 RepID=UPI00381AEB94